MSVLDSEDSGSRSEVNSLGNGLQSLIFVLRTLWDVLGKRTASILIFLFFLIWGCIFSIFPLTRELEYGILDLTQNALMRFRTPHPDLFIVGIDSETLAGIPQQWPWPRETHSRLLKKLAQGNPRFIIYDFIFQQENRSDGGAGDRILAETIKESGKVGLVAPIEQESTETGLEKHYFPNAKIFRESAKIEGFVWGIVDRDGLIRSFVAEDILLGKSSCVFQVASEFKPGILLPSPDRHGRKKTLLSFANRSGDVPSVSAIELLNGTLDPRILKDKIVLVGATAPILHDFFRTSRGSVPGVRILAATLDSLLMDRIVDIKAGGTWRFFSSLIGVSLGLIGPMWKPFASFFMALFIPAGSFIVWAGILTMGSYLPFAPLLLSWLLGTMVALAIRNLLEVLDRQTLFAEANAAGEIQKEFFPKTSLNLSNYLARGMCIPCSTAGGDFYYFLSPQKDRVILMLMDVSGHGIGAAMVTSMLKGLVSFWEAGVLKPLEELVKNLNTMLFQVFTKPKKMVTGVFFELQETNHRLSMASAGQTPCYIVRQKGDVEELKIINFPLGVKVNVIFKLHSIFLNKGDAVIMYTDGIVEARNWQSEPYGYNRWKENLSRVVPHMAAEVPLSRLLDDLQEFTAGRPFDDDVTIVLLQRKT